MNLFFSLRSVHTASAVVIATLFVIAIRSWRVGRFWCRSQRVDDLASARGWDFLALNRLRNAFPPGRALYARNATVAGSQGNSTCYLIDPSFFWLRAKCRMIVMSSA